MLLFFFVLILSKEKKKSVFATITLKDSKNSRERINCFKHIKIILLLVKFIFAKIKNYAKLIKDPGWEHENIYGAAL